MYDGIQKNQLLKKYKLHRRWGRIVHKDEVWSIELFCCCAVKTLVLESPLLMLKSRQNCVENNVFIFCAKMWLQGKPKNGPHVVFNYRELHSWKWLEKVLIPRSYYRKIFWHYLRAHSNMFTLRNIIYLCNAMYKSCSDISFGLLNKNYSNMNYSLLFRLSNLTCNGMFKKKVMSELSLLNYSLQHFRQIQRKVYKVENYLYTRNHAIKNNNKRKIRK